MAKVQTVEHRESLQKITSFVVAELKAGTDKAAISSKLAEMGVSKAAAHKFVEQVHSQALKVAKEEKLTTASVLPALLGAVAAAVAGGIGWGLIAIFTGYEIGFAAVGMGLLSGFAVTAFSRGKRGTALQVAAVAAGVVGILIGKYITFVHFVGDALAQQFGSGLPYFSFGSIALFISNINLTFGIYDLLWIVLAVAVAWKIPKGIGIKG